MGILYPRLASELFRIRAIKFGAFRLKLHETNPDAPLSPFYIDLRLLRSHPDVMRLVVKAYWDSMQGCEYDIIADVPTAATPIVSNISYEFEVPMITPRELKSHGSGARIDGEYEAGQVVLVLDDLVTKAHSKLEAIKILEAGGLVVRDVVVLVDREQGGAEEVRNAGYGFHAIYRIGELLDFYVGDGNLTPEKRDEVMTYIRENA